MLSSYTPVNHLRLYVCTESVRLCARSHVSRSVWSRLRGCYLSLDLISVSRYRQGVCWCVRAVEGCFFKTDSVLSTNSALHCAAHQPIFLSGDCSVYLKLGRQLSKMITLCIKHVAVSNVSFPSYVFSPWPLTLRPLITFIFFLSDPMGEKHHTWGTSRIFTLMVVVCICLSVFFFLTTYTHTHVPQHLTFVL